MHPCILLVSPSLPLLSVGLCGPASTSLLASKSLGSHSLPSCSRFPDPILSMCLAPFPGFLSSSFLSVCVSLLVGFCVARFRPGSRASPPLQINKPSPPPPLSQGAGAGMWGALILSHPTRAGEARGPVVPGWLDSAGLGAETEGARGVLRCQRARAAPRAFPPPTHSQPRARTARRAHVVRPRLLERAARSLGGAR